MKTKTSNHSLIRAAASNAKWLNASLPDLSQIVSIIPDADRATQTVFLKTGNDEIDIAWDYLIRDITSISEYVSRIKDTEQIKHYPILLQEPRRVLSKLVSSGLDAFLSHYGFNTKDAEIVNRQSPVVLKVNLASDLGRSLDFEISEAKKSCVLALALLQAADTSNPSNLLQRYILLKGFSRDSHNELIESFLRRHHLKITYNFLDDKDTESFCKSVSLSYNSQSSIAVLDLGDNVQDRANLASILQSYHQYCLRILRLTAEYIGRGTKD